MPERMTAISVRGKNLKRAVNDLAAKRGVKAGDLVAEALMKAYGDEIRPRLIFFAKDGQQIDHKDKGLTSDD
jgi:hypothetical protein